MSDKHCDCGRCHYCNGYVQDANNPSRYVNLETGKERNLDNKKWKLDWLILWFLIALFFTHYGQINPVKNPVQLQQSSRGLVN
ncbi:hypothetical protein NIES2101_37515 [Calothrix sp. HK-06]|nr:hypothetical protein NIES2101_37515 [Calothrix sp. HK-06]